MKQLLAGALILTLAVLFSPSDTLAQVERPPEIGQVTSTQCPIDVPDAVMVECAVLHVPENYANPKGPTIDLPYILLHSKTTDQARDPLLYTVGGPGWSSLDSVWGFVNSPILDDRDVIVFEQRGNRYAEPSLFCDSSIWWKEAPGYTPCLDSIRDKGVDIAQYNTENIVQDIITLRQALGYEQWNLYGTSFSTTLMLLILEADPDGVRSAILQSVKPPNETIFDHEADSALRAIQQMFADCAADSRCMAAYPDLEAQFYTLVMALNQSPVQIEVRSSLNDELIPLEIDGDKFIDWIVLQYMYQPAFPPFGTAYLPLLIIEVSRGNLAPLKSAAQRFWNGMPENPQWSLGLLLAINCQQEIPMATSIRSPADVDASEMLDGFSSSAAQRSVCAAWDLPALPPEATDYVHSDIPALVLAGSYDPITPPAWSRATADHLPNSTYVEFAGYGHNVTINNPCAEELQAAFLQDPQKILDISCQAGATEAFFILPEDVFIAPGLANSVNDVSLGDSQGTTWIETMSLVSLLGLSTLLVLLVVVGMVWLVRRRKNGSGLDKSAVAAYLLALLVIVTTLTMPILVTQVNHEYLGQKMILYSFGPSHDFGPAVLLAWLSPLAGLLIVALAIITLWAWLARRWPRSLKVLATLVVLASLTMVVLGLRWGLFTMLV